MALGKTIQHLRDKIGLNQKELAEKIGVSYSVMNRIELGNRPVRDDELKKIAEVLDVSVDYLLGNSDIRNPYKDHEELPDEFETPEEAIKFLLEQNVIMGFGGFDVNDLSDEEKVEFANELLNQLKLLSYKYKK